MIRRRYDIYIRPHALRNSRAANGVWTLFTHLTHWMPHDSIWRASDVRIRDTGKLGTMTKYAIALTIA